MSAFWAGFAACYAFAALAMFLSLLCDRELALEHGLRLWLPLLLFALIWPIALLAEGHHGGDWR